MKYSRISQVAATLIFGLGQVIGHCGTYYDSSSVSGWTEAALTPEGLGGGDFVSDFGTLIETSIMTLWLKPYRQWVLSLLTHPAELSISMGHRWLQDPGQQA